MASGAATEKMESTAAPSTPNHRVATAPLFCAPALTVAFEPALPGEHHYQACIVRPGIKANDCILISNLKIAKQYVRGRQKKDDHPTTPI
jgi:hypothetical protein